MTEAEIKKTVREGYAEIARSSGSCCGAASSCCGGTDLARDISQKMETISQRKKEKKD